MLDKVLLPVDFSPPSMMMLECAVELKELGSKELILLHATPGRGITPEDRRKLEDLEVGLSQAGIQARAIIRTGDPVTVIVEEADKDHVDMIAMASGGKGRTEAFFVGSVSMGVMHRTSKPILLDKYPAMQVEGQKVACRSGEHLFRNAVVSLDIPMCSSNLEDLFGTLCERGLKEATLLHVIDSAKFKMSDDGRFAAVKKILGDVKARKAKGACKVSTHIHYGTSAYNILEVAREIDASIIIVGTKQQSYLAGLTIGSTAEEVVRKAKVPVLVVPC